MPPRGKAADVVRIAEGVSGRVRMRSELRLRFDYGSIVQLVDALHGVGRQDDAQALFERLLGLRNGRTRRSLRRR
jgi:hypothetical protein